MSVPALLREAESAGLTVSVAGGNLRLKAPSAPPPDLMQRLKEHKSAIIDWLAGEQKQAVSVSGDCFDPPPYGRAPEWRRWYMLLIEHKCELGHDLSWARRLAYGEGLNSWHVRFGYKPRPNCCAGCGDPVATPMVLPDGALVCSRDDCLIAYGSKWQSVASAGLAALGIREPEANDGNV
jgi:hypothetical protein